MAWRGNCRGYPVFCWLEYFWFAFSLSSVLEEGRLFSFSSMDLLLPGRCVRRFFPVYPFSIFLDSPSSQHGVSAEGFLVGSLVKLFPPSASRSAAVYQDGRNFFLRVIPDPRSSLYPQVLSNDPRARPCALHRGLHLLIGLPVDETVFTL